jgi:hypothetical protein
MPDHSPNAGNQPLPLKPSSATNAGESGATTSKDVASERSAILVVSGDLMTMGRLRGVGQSVDRTIHITASIDRLDATLPIGFVVADLAWLKASPEEIARAIDVAYPAAKRMAFAPHVDVDRIERATAAGFLTVPRSQAERALQTLAK